MIEKEKIIKRIKSQIAVCNEIDSDWIHLTVGTGKRILELFDEQPEIIRCERCKHYRDGYCSLNDIGTTKNWFCADGKVTDDA